jgi:hypothetical protein
MSLKLYLTENVRFLDKIQPKGYFIGGEGQSSSPRQKRTIPVRIWQISLLLHLNTRLRKYIRLW